MFYSIYFIDVPNYRVDLIGDELPSLSFYAVGVIISNNSLKFYCPVIESNIYLLVVLYIIFYNNVRNLT